MTISIVRRFLLMKNLRIKVTEFKARGLAILEDVGMRGDTITVTKVDGRSPRGGCRNGLRGHSRTTVVRSAGQ